MKGTSVAYNHQQASNPAKLGAALMQLANSDTPPLRYWARSDTYQQATGKLQKMLGKMEQYRKLSHSTNGI